VLFDIAFSQIIEKILVGENVGKNEGQSIKDDKKQRRVLCFDAFETVKSMTKLQRSML